MESSTTLDPIPLATERVSPIEVLIGVLFRPHPTFVKMREAIVGHWWVVLILAVIGLALSTAATVPIEAEAASAVFEAQMEDMSEDEQAQMERIQNVSSSQLMLGGIGLGFGLFGLLLGYVVRAGVLYLLGLAFGGRASFKQVWRMAIWTTLPDALRTIVAAIAVFATGQLPVAGLGYIFTPDEMSEISPILLAFLGTIDVYMIWSFVLMGIGLYATYQISKGKSILITVIFWLMGLAFILASAAIGQMMTSAFVGAG